MGDKLDGLANLSSVYTRERFSHFQALPDHLSQDQARRGGCGREEEDEDECGTVLYSIPYKPL